MLFVESIVLLLKDMFFLDAFGKTTWIYKRVQDKLCCKRLSENHFFKIWALVRAPTIYIYTCRSRCGAWSAEHTLCAPVARNRLDERAPVHFWIKACAQDQNHWNYKAKALAYGQNHRIRSESSDLCWPHPGWVWISLESKFSRTKQDSSISSFVLQKKKTEI